MIAKFSGPHSFLSNFYPSPIRCLDRITYPTVEHAFQAHKSQLPEDRRRVAGASTPRKAKAAGRALDMRADWLDVRVEVMAEMLRLKFGIPELRAALLATAGEELIEGNNWGDRFWGKVGGDGENTLGRLLMRLRSDLHIESLRQSGHDDLTVDEAGFVLRVQRAAIYRYLKAGRFAGAYKTNGACPHESSKAPWRIPLSDIVRVRRSRSIHIDP